MTLLGTSAAAVLFVCGNVLASRFYERWDATSAGLYTPSPVTLETLDRLSEPVEVVVFLSRADPLSHSVQTLLDAYRSRSSWLRTRFVDPDRNPAEFIALQQQYGLFEGKTQNGRLATEASLVVARGDKRWFITTDDIVVFDEDDGLAKPRLEQALTEGLVNVLDREDVGVCLTEGHRELTFDSGGPQSLGEFRRSLEQNNYRVRSVNLAGPSPEETLTGCRVIVIAGPEVPFSREAAGRVAAQLERGASLFALVGPLSDDEGRILEPGLEPVLARTGIAFERNVLFEGDDRVRLPVGVGGEVFLASPLDHETTQAFFQRGEVRDRVLIQLGQGLSVDPKGTARPLLRTSPRAVSIASFRVLRTGELQAESAPEPREYTVAATWEAALGAESGEGTSTPQTRVLVIGTPSVLWSNTFGDPGLLSTRRFVENAVTWLAEQPPLVTVPEKPARAAGLDLTEAALDEVRRYVLLYMPVCVALLGALVAIRRRKDLPEDPTV